LRKVALRRVRKLVSARQRSARGPSSARASAELWCFVEGDLARRAASTCEGLCLARTLATSGQRLSPLHWSFTLAWTPCSTSQYTTSPPTLRIAGARQRMHARTHARTHSPSLSAACVRLPCDVCAWARAQAEGARPGLCTGLWLLDACCGEM